MLDKIKSLESEATVLKSLLEKFPDLQEEHGRFNIVRLTSELVNAQATEVHLHYSCGCCNDAVLYARPYVKVGDRYIYSRPNQFSIGEKNPHGYRATYKIYDSWEKEMKDAGINPALIEKLRKAYDGGVDESESVFQ